MTPALVFLVCCTFMVITGVLDDRYNLGVAPRIASEILVAAFGTTMLGLKLTNLGNRLGTGDITLNTALAYPFTTIYHHCVFLGGFALYCVVCQRSWWHHLEKQNH